MKVENSAGGAFTTATVAPGTTVMFINNDTTNIHNIHFTVVPSGVTLAVNPSPNTNLWTLAKTGFPSNTFSFTLTTAGTYTFFCDYHDWMTGTITVT